MMDRNFFIEAQHIHLVICWLPDTLPYFLVFQSKRVGSVFFIAHVGYLGALALTGCTRGVHTHWLASSALLLPRVIFPALHIPSGEYRCCYVLSGLDMFKEKSECT